MARSLGPLTGAQVVARARGAIGKGTKYRLGAGGRNPSALEPGRKAVAWFLCDCSGFAAWCVGVDRYLPNAAIPTLPGGDWFETSALVRDALSPFGFVVKVPWAEAHPGDLVVWPDDGALQGHVGIVAEVGTTGPDTVVHCSSGNGKTGTGDAIAETDAGMFLRHGALVARVAWVA